MKTRFAVSAGGVVVRPADRGWETVLAARRTRGGDLVWGLAKGQVEEGETVEEAALREVEEETGVSARVRRALKEVSYWFVWGGARVRKTVHFFLMDATGGDVSRHDREMEDVRWFPLDEAVALAGYDSEKEVLRLARDALASPDA